MESPRRIRTALNHLSPSKSHNTNEKAKMPKDIENSISNDNKYYHEHHSIVGTETGTTPASTLQPVREVPLK